MGTKSSKKPFEVKINTQKRIICYVLYIMEHGNTVMRLEFVCHVIGVCMSRDWSLYVT